MLSSSRDALLKLSKTKSPKKLFQSDCITLYKERKLVMQSDGNIFLGDVVFDSFNMVYSDEESLLDQKDYD